MRHSRITLYLPDLAAGLRASGIRRLPLLEKIMARAHGRQVENGATVLGECFGLQPEEFPRAALERLGRMQTREPGFWWRADPVHLLVDRDQLAMLPRRVLGVSAEEAAALVAKFNEAYSEDGFVLDAPVPEAWYLRVPTAWHCRTRDPAEVEGWAITEFMPAGADENALRKLMNGIQMLFFEHPVNQAREQRGQVTINTLWLWGGGALPDRVDRSPARIVGNMPLLRGLAVLGGRRCEAWRAESLASRNPGDLLIGATLADFAADPARLERELLKPSWRALLRGRAHALECFPGGTTSYTLTRAAALKFWRRPRAAARAELDTAGAAAAD